MLLLLSSFSFGQDEGYDIRPYLEKGNQYYDSLEFRSAATNYKHACKLDSSSYDAWFNFASALYKLDKYILSSEAYEKALENAVDSAAISECNYGLGNCYIKIENYTKAMEYFRKALLQNPLDNDARYNYAYANKMHEAELEKQKKKEQEEQQNQNKQKEPDYTFADKIKAEVDKLVNEGKFVEAYSLFEQAAEKDSAVLQKYGEFEKKLKGVALIILGIEE